MKIGDTINIPATIVSIIDKDKMFINIEDWNEDTDVPTKVLISTDLPQPNMPTPMLREMAQVMKIFKDLNDARAKSEILINEIDDEMTLKTKQGILWRRDQCAAWLAMEDAMGELGKLREEHSV